MNTYFTYILGLLLITGSAVAQVDRSKVPTPGPAPEIRLADYEKFTLDNGLTVIVVENHKIPRVSFSVSLDIDPIYEGDKLGYISMAGQLMNTGTASRTKAMIDEEVDFIGATMSAYSGGVSGGCLTKHQDKLLELMTDVLYKPTFPEEELEKLKTQTLSGLAAYQEDPSQIASGVADIIRYGKDHPYGELMREENVRNITVEDCRDYYQTYFKPNVAYLTIVGDISVDQAKQVAEKYFASWEQGEVPQNAVAKTPGPESTKVVFVDRPQAVQSIIRVTYPVELYPGTEEVIKSRVMNSILGGGFSSYLSQNLRETYGYTYGAGSSLSSDEFIGSFSAGTSTRNNVTDSAIAQIFVELERIRTEEVDPQFLQDIKNYITGGFARSLESPSTIARFALNIERYDLPNDYYKNYLKAIDAVSQQDVLAMAKKFILPENAYILVVGKKEEVAESLRKFGPVEYYDIYGNLLED